jgi:signal transduction histidine kinase
MCYAKEATPYSFSAASAVVVLGSAAPAGHHLRRVGARPEGGPVAVTQPLPALLSQPEDCDQDLTLLYDVAVAMSRSLELEPILETALDIVIDRLDMAAGTIYLYDEEQQRFVGRAHRGLNCEQIRRLEHFQSGVIDFVANIVGSGRMEFAPDASSIELGRLLWEDPEQRSMAALPLMARGRVVGAIGITSKPGQQFGRQGAQTLLAVGHEIGIAIENALLIAQVRRSEEEARTLSEVALAASASLELRRVLDVVAEGARQVLKAEIGAVALLDTERQEFVVQAVAGGPPGLVTGKRFPVREGEPGATLARGEPVIIDGWDPSTALSTLLSLLACKRPLGALLVPLRRSGRLVGVVGAFAHERRFTQREAQFLARLAGQVVLCIENAQLYQQAQQVAALQERDRLARELHDSLAQTLGILNLRATMVDDALVRGEVEEARTCLRELKAIVQDAYADAREAVFSLRSAANPGTAFLPTVAEYLEDYRAQFGLQVHLEADCSNLPKLPKEVEIQVSRIVQETLTNVRKHAAASAAWVRLGRDEGHLIITVRDDGRGFDPTQVQGAGRRCFGLQVMRERAHSVGATVQISSCPGQGTEVVIRAPLAGGE